MKNKIILFCEKIPDPTHENCIEICTVNKCFLFGNWNILAPFCSDAFLGLTTTKILMFNSFA